MHQIKTSQSTLIYKIILTYSVVLTEYTSNIDVDQGRIVKASKNKFIVTYI